METFSSHLIFSLFSSSFTGLVNVAYRRPTFQISTWENHEASNAVDGKRNADRERNYDRCAKTRSGKDPWWRVDLGKSVWVESVLIASRTDPGFKGLSNVEIRIGNTSNHWFIMLCDVNTCTTDLQEQ